MSIQFILGSSGSGKSYTLYESIIQESIKHPEKKYLIIVPEQFTMETQKELVNLHPAHGILNIDVLSFGRLAYRVFEEVGGGNRKVLEETGKSLMLRKVAIEKREELKTLRGGINKPGYIAQLKSMISELTQYDVGEEEMDRLVDSAKDRPGLWYKLQDIRVLYQGFREKTRENYVTAEETLEELCEVVADSAMLRDCVIAIDGFTGFTPIQQKLLAKLFPLAEKVTITITMDGRNTDLSVKGIYELFYLSKKTLQSLTKIGVNTGTEILEPIVLKGSPPVRFREAPMLAFLEQHMFRYERAVCQQDGEEISIHGGKNVVEETHFAARTISKLISRGYRYRDIAVITGDMALYRDHLPRIFKWYDIPCFVDETRTVLLSPLIEFVRAVLEVNAQGYSYGAMFRYLRTGLAGVTREETDLLDNYVLATGIRGITKWSRPWERTTRKIKEEQLVELNELREKVMTPLAVFHGAMRGAKKTVEQRTRALYDLLVALEIQKAMAEYEESFKKEGNLAAAREYAQIYGIVIELLDKLVELLGQEVIDVREYTQILEAGFEEAKVGIIPPTEDVVTIGDIERTRLKGVKVLFFLGLNDGSVPKSTGPAAILSDMEREALKESQVELAPTVTENSYIQRFYLYLNMTKPSKRLYLSYGKAGMEGTGLRPSYIIHQVQTMFPKISVVDEDVYPSPYERVLAPRVGLDYLLEGLHQWQDQGFPEHWMELYRWYYTREEYRPLVGRLVEAAYLTREEEGLGSQVARALYGEVLENSVTRLEQFAACAYAHFLTYGLGLSQRETYEFAPTDMGLVFHKAIELFSQKIERSRYTWFEIPEDIQEQWMENCVDEVCQEYGGQILQSSARNGYALQRMKRIMKRSVWALVKQIRAGEFIPSNYEVGFHMVEGLEAVNISLNEQEKMKLQGRIDRIDTCETEDTVYVKVIDYKSGSKSFDLVAVYHGLQLQLVVYLNAALELEKRVHPHKQVEPAGVFYYRMQDPMLDREVGDDGELINKRILKKLKLSGLVSDNPEAVRKMDAGIEKESSVLPLSYKKDGTPTKYSSTANREQFKALSGFVNRKIADLGRNILAGDAMAKPYIRGNETGCDYCQYRSVCEFDGKIPGTEYKRVEEQDTSEIWNRIEGEADRWQ